MARIVSILLSFFLLQLTWETCKTLLTIDVRKTFSIAHLIVFYQVKYLQMTVFKYSKVGSPCRVVHTMAGKGHLGKVPLRNAHALCVVLSSVKLEDVLDSLEKQ